jgi:hypothetical protein
VGTPIAVAGGVRTTLSLLFLATVTACTPAQRMATGTIVSGVGGLVVVGSVVSMTTGPCDTFNEGTTCTKSKPATAAEGLAGVGVGLGLGLVGILLMTARIHSDSSPAAATPNVGKPSSEHPTRLEELDAIGMAVAELTLNGLDGARLVEVYHAETDLRVVGANAELSGLSLRTAKDRRWQAIRVCYDFDERWRVTRINTRASCLP